MPINKLFYLTFFPLPGAIRVTPLDENLYLLYGMRINQGMENGFRPCVYAVPASNDTIENWMQALLHTRSNSSTKQNGADWLYAEVPQHRRDLFALHSHGYPLTLNSKFNVGFIEHRPDEEAHFSTIYAPRMFSLAYFDITTIYNGQEHYGASRYTTLGMMKLLLPSASVYVEDAIRRQELRPISVNIAGAPLFFLSSIATVAVKGCLELHPINIKTPGENYLTDDVWALCAFLNIDPFGDVVPLRKAAG